MSLSAELMFPVRMFLPVAPVFPAAVLSFPSVAPLFPVPETPSAELSFPVQKSLAPVSVATPFQGSESQTPLFL